MASRYSIRITQEDASLLELLYSKIPHRLLHIDLEVRCVSSFNPETTLETFNQSVVGRRDVFLSEENAQNIMHSMAGDSGASREFIDAVLVPPILSYARYADCLPAYLGRQLIRLRVELLVEVNLDNEISELVDESLANSTNFKPASKSSIEALKRVNWDDAGEEYLLLKKRRKSEESSSSSSRERCNVCLDEFSNGDEVTSMPCGHVYHYDCIVEWLETSHLCPLCRYQMPID